MLHERAKSKGHEKDCRHCNTKEWQPLPIVCVRAKIIQPYTWEQFRVNENEPGQVKTKLKRRKNNVLLVLFFN